MKYPRIKSTYTPVTPSEASTIEAMRSAFYMTRQRCLNPKCRDYKYYGGRGITLCDRWLHSFENFLSDMGLRPEGMTLERVNNDGPYSPDNCVWATRSAQGNNTRATNLISYSGKTHSIAEWERALNMKPGTLKARLNRLKYSVEEAFSKPVKCGEKLVGKQYKTRAAMDRSKIRRGVDHPNSKLQISTVIQARLQYKSGGQTFSSLARLYGVSITTMSNAIQGFGSYSGVK